MIGYDLTNLEKNYDMLSVAYTNLYQKYLINLMIDNKVHKFQKNKEKRAKNII